ncbi:phospholipase, partial [Bordetella pertussis]
MQVPDPRSPFIRPALAGALALALAGMSLPALAGISYRLDRPAAAPGETVRLEAVFFNDGSASAAWNAPQQLVLQWRGADDQTIRSLAQRPAGEAALNIPVNNFARMSWDAVVPVHARGLQAVSIEGESTMLALDATGREQDTLASTPADVPVTDARTGQPLP